MKSQTAVVLIHGLGRTKLAMRKMEQALLRDNYAVLNLNYPSRRFDIPTLVERFIRPQVTEFRAQHTSCHFVTHSLGGILLRYLDAHWGGLNDGRCVMLAPPNHGSEIAQLLKQWSLPRLFIGPVLSQLGTDGNSIPLQLPACGLDVGVITGNKSYEPWLSKFIEGENDGKVSVASASLGETVPLEVMPVGHTYIMNNDRVIALVKSFLSMGQFNQSM